MTSLRVDSEPTSVIRDALFRRPEGMALQPAGPLAVADAEANRVTLYRRRDGSGAFERSPFCIIDGRRSRLNYSHDVDFSPDGELLAVANRQTPSITLYPREGKGGEGYAARPVFEIRGRKSELIYTDGVQFVPPTGEYLAACNRTASSVTFYRRRWPAAGVEFGLQPCFRLAGPETRIDHPDGLGFSPDGELLAVTNHRGQSVTLYRRRASGFGYGPNPVAELRGADARLRHPHSAAFSSSGAHLAISNAGGKTVNVYRRERDDPSSWAPAPVFTLEAHDRATFDAQNRRNREEGGSKGIAVGGACLAICSAEIGARIHPFVEGG